MRSNSPATFRKRRSSHDPPAESRIQALFEGLGASALFQVRNGSPGDIVLDQPLKGLSALCFGWFICASSWEQFETFGDEIAIFRHR
jgi:hypothetical protein